MKKRIGVIMYQTSKSKGQELVAQRMVGYFRRLNHEAYLITSIYHDGREIVADDLVGEKGYVLVNDAELNIPIIRVASFVTKWPPRRIVFKDQVEILERIVNEFKLNVLITHSTLWNGPEEVAKFVEWRRNIKSLGGFQDSLIFCHMSHYQEPSPRRYSIIERSFRMAWNKLALGTILRVADLILVVTPYEQEEKMKMGASKAKCILFPGGIDDNSFTSYATSNPDELLQRLNVGHDAKIVTYMGTIEERKNLQSVLEVAERLKDRKEVHFVIAGNGESEYAKETMQRAKELPNVTYLGEVNEKEKVQLITISYLNILLSKMEALGITQLEFMYLGVPVITSGIGGQSWIVRDNHEGIRVAGPNDVNGARNAIVDLVDDASKWKKLSTSAKERANDFTLTKLIQLLDDAITREIERETGLINLPPEVKTTLTEPEVVDHTWSHGTKKIVATNKRLFIQQGKLSRSTLEIPYSKIHSIEHIRRYSWKALIIGTTLSSLMFVQHYVSPIISRPLTSEIPYIITPLASSLGVDTGLILASVWTVPITASLLIFLYTARKGYALHGPTLDPIYLPQTFSEAIQYIRGVQDQIQFESRMNNSANEPEDQASLTKIRKRMA
ncbi:MAG: glycosyltransferase [Candidatus Bathyarchaeia archaeon]